jgi:transmembrane sensor
MNPSRKTFDPETEDQASLWAARLEGTRLTAAERSELDAWLAGEPERRVALAQFCQLSARLDRLVPALVEAGSIEVREAEPPMRRGFNPWKVATAGLATAALAVGLFWFEGRGAGPETISTPAGQRQSFTLADGSRVELNANTSIFVENGKSERRIRLANGEAFFVVSRDKARPFIVETPAGSVQVTGTIFNVLTEAASQLDVTVVEGSVQVSTGESGGSTPAGPVLLHPGERLSSAQGGVALSNLSASELEDALAWRQGKIVCDGMQLAEALARFGHYHGIAITATPGAEVLRVGGRYSLDDLDGFLAQLEQVVKKVHVDRLASGAVRVRLLTEP